MQPLLLLLLWSACLPAAPPQPPLPLPDLEMTVEVCGETRPLARYKPHTYDTRDQLSFLRTETELPRALQVLQYGRWVGVWQPRPGEPALLWFDLHRDLPRAALEAEVQASFDCDLLGGDGQVFFEDGTVLAIQTLLHGGGLAQDDAYAAMCGRPGFCTPLTAAAEQTIETADYRRITLRDGRVAAIWRPVDIQRLPPPDVRIVKEESGASVVVRPEHQRCTLDEDCAMFSIDGSEAPGTCVAIHTAHLLPYYRARSYYGVFGLSVCVGSCELYSPPPRCEQGTCRPAPSDTPEF